MQLKKIESFSSLKLAHPLFIKCFLSKSKTTNSTLTKVGQNSVSALKYHREIGNTEYAGNDL